MQSGEIGDLATLFQNTSFWQANFWGILGSITGVAGLIIGWFSFKYNTPKIEIDKMYLVIPDWAQRDWKGKTVQELNSNFLDFELEIVVRNKRGGAGSIDKPNLVLGIPDNPLLFIKKQRYIVLPPNTEHQESKKESESVTSYWTIRHGRAFNLGGGEKVDENLEYETDDAQQIYDIIQNFSEIKYYAEYRDNNGKFFKKRITKIYNESDKDKD